ncbi:dihydrolipoamide acetyltransferase family protein [Niallia endozanthoxylica]|uniref:Dihydrolipoamide acetyltransferase component of pyruvate dehydrogenase complex n=1 Tax=Niallia endozanthoxylica TaxID=2036016 RepID=A0A5J5HVS7_9BACI|nr:dihydrolipoamide acetyltransferase family protein [Niallia endozanthoxylica]KAA9026231.1 2-oxo acid dehydrogenase subunit E2 [Niallia endozanthoxylica]
MTIEKIIMPKLGESVTEGTLSKWLISVGDRVKKYDPLAEIITDKVNAEVPSSFTGIIKELMVGEGDTLPVGAAICVIETELEPVIEDDMSSEGQKRVEQKVSFYHEGRKEPALKLRYSPAVLKLSQEYGIDLKRVKGTGAGGRITRKDLLQLVSSGGQTEQNEMPKPSASHSSADVVSEARIADTPGQKNSKIIAATGDTEIPVTGLRKTIAANMVKSKHEIPHAWMMVEADVTNLVEYRNEIKTEFYQKEGFNLTFFAFIVKAVAQALKEFPQMNAMWAGDKIIRKKEINLSIAVATEDALFVPVIKHADEKTVKGIAREISVLAEKVRTGTTKVEDFQGGTFTVNNTGSIGSVQSMGIINYPQAAILQVESIIKRPVVMNQNMIAVRDMMNLCLSLDHRILDGFICGKFMNRVKEILENTTKDNTPIY